MKTNEIENLSDAELLAMFLPHISLSYSLLKNFGGIRNLFDASKDQICKSPGMSDANYLQLQAILELAKRYLEEQLINTNIISNAQTAHLYLTSKLRNYKREVFACIFLDEKYSVVHYEEIFYGTINNITVYPREIAKVALKYNSSALIFAHNHPSGNVAPSAQDKHLTKSLIKILRPLNISVLDHIIIGSNNYLSLVD